MMNRTKTVLLIFGIAVISGCASQGKKIGTDFRDEELPRAQLQEKMKWLEPVIAEGTVDEQYRVVKALRHVTKYNTDGEKRRLAVQGLIIVTAFAADADVRSSANSRLTAILNDSGEDLELRRAVIDGKTDLVLARAYYEEKNPSLFSNVMEIEPVYPDEDHREDALHYLIDHFEDQEIVLQQHMISSFRKILGSRPVCIEKSDSGCETYDTELQENWKKALGRQINYWAFNDCDWHRDSVAPEIRNALIRLQAEYPDVIDGKSPVCTSFHPVSEDYSVLEMRSIKIPDSYWQLGADVTDAAEGGLHAANLEFGFGNGKTFGIILGTNIDEQWVQPLREKYLTILYRPPGSNSIIGATRTIRTPNFSLNESSREDVKGTVDGESRFAFRTDENELFIATAVAIESIQSHMHIYLGPIHQKLALQYFFRQPDISFILEGTSRSDMKVWDRETDTLANNDKSERESQAADLRNDILLGAKWNNLSLLQPLFVGRANRPGRQGIFNFRLYHSLKRKKTYFTVTSPF